MSLQTQVNFNNSSPIHTYYDINILNNDKTGQLSSVPITFTDTRTDVIVKNPSEYFLSVTGFSVDTPSLPLFCPLIDFRSLLPNINKTIYQIAIRLGRNATSGGGISETLFIPIIFTPQDLTVPVPSLADVEENNIRDYYYIYSYQHFINCINSSIANAISTATTGITESYIPQFTFDTKTNIASVYFPQNNTFTRWGGDFETSVGGRYFMFMNAPLYNLFSSFNADYVESIPSGGLVNVPVDDGWYNLTINPNYAQAGTTTVFTPDQSNLLGVNTIPASALPDRNTNIYTGTITHFSIITQDYPTTPLWNPVQSLVITTALMPIANELTGVPNIFNDDNNSNNNRNFSPILSTIDLPMKRGDEYKPTVNYTPVAEYKLSDLQSNVPVNSIQISVFWRDNYNTLHPLLLDAGCTAVIKLMFRKKIFNLSNI
jgi:hypothetical protein